MNTNNNSTRNMLYYEHSTVGNNKYVNLMDASIIMGRNNNEIYRMIARTQKYAKKCNEKTLHSFFYEQRNLNIARFRNMRGLEENGGKYPIHVGENTQLELGENC